MSPNSPLRLTAMPAQASRHPATKRSGDIEAGWRTSGDIVSAMSPFASRSPARGNVFKGELGEFSSSLFNKRRKERYNSVYLKGAKITPPSPPLPSARETGGVGADITVVVNGEQGNIIMRDQSMASAKPGNCRNDRPPPIQIDHRGRCCVCGQGFGNLTSVMLGDGRKAHLTDYRMAPASGGRRRQRRGYGRTHHRD